MKSGVTRQITVLSLMALASAGLAQAQTPINNKYLCMSTGSSMPEPVGDREGHFIQVLEGTCQIESGPMEGAIVTQNTIWEMDKGAAKMSAGHGVFRKAGGIGVYQLTEGTRTPVMQDGKMVGWNISGKGVYPMAGGSVAAYAGRKFSFIAKNAGFGRYTMETTVE